CAVSRPDPATAATRLRATAARAYPLRSTLILLGPLAAPYGRELVGNLLATETPTLPELILARTEGNPFFIEEVVRSLIANGTVVASPRTGRWHAVAAPEQVAIPSTVQDVIMARIEQLGAEAQAVLRTAAVIGRGFSLRLLQAAVGPARDVEPHLASLEQ